MITGLKNMGSKQKAAWESILAYVKEHGGSTTVTFTLGDVVGSKETLDKLVSRKVLNVKKSYNNGFYYRDYSVNPNYLPASEPAAEPESEPVAVDAPRFKVGDNVVVSTSGVAHQEAREIAGVYPGEYTSKWMYTLVLSDGREGRMKFDESVLETADAPGRETPRLELGRVVTILAGEAEGEVGYICGLDHTAGTFKVRIEETGYWAWYKADELEPVTASEPATDDAMSAKDEQFIYDTVRKAASAIFLSPELARYPGSLINQKILKHLNAGQTDDRPTTDEARLIDSLTEARIDRQRLENENASLASQLEALRVYVKELEAENAKLRDENAHLLAALDFWRPKDERATGSKL